jgi:hypothetical protein
VLPDFCSGECPRDFFGAGEFTATEELEMEPIRTTRSARFALLGTRRQADGCRAATRLERLASTCERILAEQTEGHDTGVRAVMDDVNDLLRRLSADLDATA